MSTTVQTKQTAYYGGNRRIVGITNGSAAVSLSVGYPHDTLPGGIVEALALSPKKARQIAVALLNAAENVEAGKWGGATDDPEREHNARRSGWEPGQ